MKIFVGLFCLVQACLGFGVIDYEIMGNLRQANEFTTKFSNNGLFLYMRNGQDDAAIEAQGSNLLQILLNQVSSIKRIPGGKGIATTLTSFVNQFKEMAVALQAQGVPLESTIAFILPNAFNQIINVLSSEATKLSPSIQGITPTPLPLPPLASAKATTAGSAAFNKAYKTASKNGAAFVAAQQTIINGIGSNANSIVDGYVQFMNSLGYAAQSLVQNIDSYRAMEFKSSIEEAAAKTVAVYKLLTANGANGADIIFNSAKEIVNNVLSNLNSLQKAI